MSLLLESKKSRPFRVSTAIWLRRITWVIVALGALAVLLASVLVKADEIGSNANIIWLVTLKSLIHLSYLYLIFWLLILKEPPDMLYKQKLIFPLVLLCGYLLYFSAAYTGYANTYGQNIPFFDGNRIALQGYLETITQLAFLLLYLLWFFRDIEEWKKNKNRKRRAEIFLWIIIESVACIVLLIRAFHEFKILKIPNQYIDYIEKDTVIVFCLGLWIFIAIYEILREQGGYRNLYEGYLKYNKFIKCTPDKFNLAVEEQNFKILDFGCGNGLRLKEISEWCAINEYIDSGAVDVIGFDCDQSWGPAYKQFYGEKNNILFESSKDEIPYEELKVVVLSHVLYHNDSVKDACEILTKCKNGTIVIIRGASPDSFFTLTSMVFSLRLLTPTYSHCWYKDHLNQIMDNAHLVRLVPGVATNKPDASILQEYHLNNDSIQNAQNLLGFLYGKTAGDTAARYFYELLNYADVDCIPNNDHLYIYKINRPK